MSKIKLDQKENNGTRRHILSLLWSTPAVSTVILPAHAQMSPGEITCNSLSADAMTVSQGGTITGLQAVVALNVPDASQLNGLDLYIESDDPQYPSSIEFGTGPVRSNELGGNTFSFPDINIPADIAIGTNITLSVEYIPTPCPAVVGVECQRDPAFMACSPLSITVV